MILMRPDARRTTTHQTTVPGPPPAAHIHVADLGVRENERGLDDRTVSRAGRFRYWLNSRREHKLGEPLT